MFSSLRTRLIAISVAIAVGAMALVAVANYGTTRQHTLALLDQQTAQLARSESAAIAAWLQAKQLVVASLAPAAAPSDAAAALPTVQVVTSSALQAAQVAGGFDLVFIGYPDKRAAFSQQRERSADYDPTQRPWYRLAVETGGPIVTQPYIGASTGQLLITFAAPVGTKDHVTAVAGADVLLDTVVASVLAIKPTPSSYALLIDADGRVIAHPNKALALKPLTDVDAALTKDALARIETSGTSGRVQLGAQDALLYVQPIPGSPWRLAVVLDRTEATRALGSIFITSAIATLAVALAATALLHWVITKYLRRLRRLRDAIAATGEGDFTHRLRVRGSDELTEIAAAYNRFADNIDAVLQKIRVASASVRGASEEIATGNLHLSQRTDQQVGALGETASSVSKLTGTVKQNADNAHQANELAASASEVAVKGGVVVSGVVEMMGSINESSKKVVDIIGVIDSIAFQTNILALNAAVEAARAGHQGRGFAVVATEVRALAQRSAEAAKEIKALIGDSVAKIDDGSALVARAGATMHEIVASVQRVTGIMSEITSASQDQTAEIEQINHAIAQMDRGTQQNAAMVDQAASAAGSLQEQAVSLAQALAVFRLGEQHEVVDA